MLPDEMEAEKNRKIILAQADEIDILKRNVKELQQSLQNAYSDISRLTEQECFCGLADEPVMATEDI